MSDVVEVKVPELLVVLDTSGQQVLETTTIINQLLTESVEVPSVLETAGAQGPAGPQGASNQFETHFAGRVLGGNRAVTLNSLGRLDYPDISSEDSFVIGITTGSVLENYPGEVQITGSMTEPSWNWLTKKPVFVGTDGVLTQTPPTGQLITVGIAYKPTSIFINLHPTIYQE